MRKTISLMLAAVMLLCIGVRSSATEASDPYSHTIVAGYASGETGEETISMQIKWENMSFTYYGESQAVWDPKTHTYSEARPAAWAKSTANITFTNHSNVILKADIACTMNPSYETMGLAFTDESPFIGSANTTDGGGKEVEVTIRAVPTGYLLPNTPLGTDVGTIKVTVTPVNDYGTVMTAIGSDYINIPCGSDNRVIGDVYFESVDDYNEIEAAFGETNDFVTGSGEDYKKNAELNAFLNLYYGKRLILEKPVEKPIAES